MMADTDPHLGEMPSPQERGRFPVTSWTAVVAVQREGDSAQAEAALSQLCQAYWNPLFAYVRRLGHSEPDAQDLTQQFFLELLRKHFLRAADRTKGKLRTFLLTALNHFLANEWDRANTLKRGGGKPVVSLEAEREKDGGGFEPSVEASPLKIFERQWAGTLFDRAHARLREELTTAGKESQYDLLKDFLGDRTSPGGYEEVAGKLDMNVATVRVTVHRLRQQLAKLIRAEVADTLVNPTTEEIEIEVKHLFEAFQDD